MCYMGYIITIKQGTSLLYKVSKSLRQLYVVAAVYYTVLVFV